MFSEAKVIEIYCLADDFARNLYCNRKNICLKIRTASIVTNRTV